MSAERLLAEARSILLVDWPSRDVPDSLARAGLAVVSLEGDDAYYDYRVAGAEVTRNRALQSPAQVDLVYAHRPLAELPGIVDEALRLGARAVWLQSVSDDEAVLARKLVDEAGLEVVCEPYIGDVARSLSVGR